MIIRQDYFFNVNTINPPDSTTYYIPFNYGQASTTTTNNRKFTPFMDATIVQVEARANIQGTLGSGESVTLSAYINNGATEEVLINDWTWDSELSYANNRALNVSLLTTDTLIWKLVTPAWATNPTTVNGIMWSVYYETGLERELSLQTWFFGSGSLGSYNPADNTDYWPHTSLGANSLTNTMPYQVPFSGNIVGGVLNKNGFNNASTEKINTFIDINGADTALDFTWNWSARESSKVLTLDSISIPFNANDLIVPKFSTPGWVTNPTSVWNTVSLILERT